MKSQTEFLQGYIFHFNPYTKLWAGFAREHSNDYFNGIKNDNIFTSSNIEHIIEYLKIINEKM
jgi:hypothetical protein